ncbi:hypothetical protein CAN34_02735 [Psychrobacter sp. DAB_AL32B]|nr:hypothetical protein CAN34_02735 [Psychrobacter sp. DAB_AL32B]
MDIILLLVVFTWLTIFALLVILIIILPSKSDPDYSKQKRDNLYIALFLYVLLSLILAMLILSEFFKIAASS